MHQFSDFELEVMLEDLRRKRKKLTSQLSIIDTEIIGIKIDLEKMRESHRMLTNQFLDEERSEHWDD